MSTGIGVHVITYDCSPFNYGGFLPGITYAAIAPALAASAANESGRSLGNDVERSVSLAHACGDSPGCANQRSKKRHGPSIEIPMFNGAWTGKVKPPQIQVTEYAGDRSQRFYSHLN